MTHVHGFPAIILVGLTRLTNVVGEGPFEAVEDEPAFLPGLYFSSHLHQVALAHLLGDDDVVAGLHAVARRLHMGAQVELLLPDGQVASHRTGLRSKHGEVWSDWLPSVEACHVPITSHLTDLREVLGPHLDLLLH